MRIFYFICLLFSFTTILAQKPCATNPVYRQFDFWIGEWDVYAKNGRLAGDSRIELILDSCVIVENWTNTNGSYKGKSFNTYNRQSGQWQQTWVDDKGGSTEYLKGKYENNSIVFLTEPFPFTKDTMAIRKLTFFKLSEEKVRQLGEISKDRGTTWAVEYDLEYRRRKK